MQFTGLEHTAIASPDPKKLADWYVANLGFRINYEYGGNVFVKAPDGAMIEIIPGKGTRPENEMQTLGIRHIAVTVADFDVAREELTAKGVTFLSDERNVQGNRLLFFADGDGNILHILHRKEPLP